MAWGWLKKLGRGAQAIAPIALLFIPPPFNVVAQTVYGAVRRAEEEMQGDKRGAEKFEAVMKSLAIAAPLIADQVERITGKEVVDEDALGAAIGKLAEFQVLITKAVGGKPE